MTLRLMLIFLLLLPLPAYAVQPDEMLKDTRLEARARDLSGGFRCLVCQNQSIDESDAPLARDLRILIRERLTTGDNDQQIKDFVVARYGDYILLKPRLTVSTFVLWATPFLIVLAGFGYFLRRRTSVVQIAEASLSEQEQAALRDL
jgi:cytochrome c-type biogenesis protein CcmH